MKKIIMICAILISVAGLASAAPTTLITFDEFSPGTMIDTEYAPLGVVFLPGIIVPAPPQIDQDIWIPTTPVLRPTGEAAGLDIFKGDFTIQFTTPAVEVEFISGFWDLPGAGMIDVYDPAMNPIANLTNTTPGLNTTSISGVGPIGYIYFNSIDDPSGAALDNLAFSPIPDSPIPTSPIPAPGAIVLGGIGVGLIGWLRRRRTL